MGLSHLSGLVHLSGVNYGGCPEKPDQLRKFDAYQGPHKYSDLWSAAFGIITQQAILCGSLLRVKELIVKIEYLTANYERCSTSFIWTATADSILEKLQRL